MMKGKKYYEEEQKPDFRHPIGSLVLEDSGSPKYKIIGYGEPPYESKYKVQPLGLGRNLGLGPGLSNIGNVLHPQKEDLFDKLYLTLKQ